MAKAGQVLTSLSEADAKADVKGDQHPGFMMDWYQVLTLNKMLEYIEANDVGIVPIEDYYRYHNAKDRASITLPIVTDQAKIKKILIDSTANGTRAAAIFRRTRKDKYTFWKYISRVNIIM